MGARARISATALLCACAVAIGCKESRKRADAPTVGAVPASAAEGERAGPEAEPAPPSDAGADRALWRTRVEARPGTAVLTWVNGPRRFGDEIWVGSSAIGVAALEPATGQLISHERDAEPFVRAASPDDPDLLRVVKVGGAVVSVRRDALVRADAWRYTFDDGVALGVAGPVWLGERAAAVIDETLVGLRWADGVEQWRAEGRFAHVDGGLSTAAGGVLRAVSLDGGVGPTWLDAATGAVRRAGDRAPGLSALAAAWLPGGELAVVVRRDGSLRDDALAVFDGEGRLAWQWSLPRPDEPRVDPVGLLGDGDGFVLFYDGRFCARFPRPTAP